MGCPCNQSYCPECMAGYIPKPAPKEGTSEWKDSQAFHFVLDTCGGLPKESCIIRLPHDWGYFVVRYNPGSGWDYFRAEKIKEFYLAKEKP